MRWLAVPFVALMVFAAPPIVHAQRRGGSFGGSRSFGSRRSSSSSSSRSRLGSSPSRSRGARYPQPSSRPSTLPVPSVSSLPSSASSPAPRTRHERARDPRFVGHRIAPQAGPLEYRRPPPTAGFEPRPGWVDFRPPRSPPPLPNLDTWLVGGFAGGGVFLGLLVLYGLLSFALWWRRRRAAAVVHCEVRRISLGFDWGERERVQRALEELAGRHDMSSERGLFEAGRGVFELLEGALGAARYGMWTRHHLSPSDAESKLAQIAGDLRARFTQETVRNAHREDAGPIRERSEDGEGLVVVSVVLGMTEHRADPPPRFDLETLREVLAGSLPLNSAQLVGLEVVWSPSADLDRMSSRELEQFYPELRRLDADGLLGGRSCDYCRAVFTAELGECPACGAPAAD